MANSELVRTPLGRLSFPHLFKPQEMDDGKKKYNCTLLFPKTTDLSALKALAAKVAVEEWGEKAVQQIKDGIIKSPFLDGDGPQGMNKKRGTRNDGYEGCTFIRCGAGEDHQPKVVDKNRLPLTKPSEAAAGFYVYAAVNCYTWENPKNGKGLSFGLSMIQVAKEGPTLGGGGSGDPDSVFEVIADEGDAPAETKGGAGASGLFA